MAEPGDNQESWKALGLRTDVPHPARVYNYMLGGRDNFAVDRETAERTLQLDARDAGHRAGQSRSSWSGVVAFACATAASGSSSTSAPGCRSAPTRMRLPGRPSGGARRLRRQRPGGVHAGRGADGRQRARLAVVRADLRDVDAVLADAGRLLDFAKPVALMFVAVLHCIEDRDEAVAIAARYLAALAPGSYLVLSHSTDEFAPEQNAPGLGRGRQAGRPPGCRAARTTSGGCSTAGIWSTPAWCSFPAGAPTATSPPGSPTGPGPTAASPGSSRTAVG